MNIENIPSGGWIARPLNIKTQLIIGLLTGFTNPEHVGIMSNRGTVYHYTGDSIGGTKNDAVVRETSIDDFAKGKQVRIVKVPKDSIHQKQILDKCKYFIGKGKYEYNIVFNNCEHFVNMCYKD